MSSSKLFEAEMLIRTLPTTLLQIFRKIIVNSKVIEKSIKDPDDNLLVKDGHQDVTSNSHSNIFVKTSSIPKLL